MELFLFLFGLLALAALFLPWINLFRHNALAEQMMALRAEIRELKGGQKESAVKPRLPESSKTPLKEDVVRPSHVLKAKEPPQKKERAGFNFDFEQHIGAKLPVWIGGIALVFAAFYLVKYSIETGLLGPEMRIALGSLFGLSLLGAGHWILGREAVANSVRIAQAFVGAGLVALYISLYAATNMYDFLSPAAGFVGMAVVTAVGVVMSLRHGQPIAVFALVGGLLTPALIDSASPNPVVLFSYLFILFAGLLFVMSRMGWWLLAVLALVGMYGWTLFWLLFLFEPLDNLVMVLFVFGLVALSFMATQAIVRGQEEAAKTKKKEEEKRRLFFIKPQHWLNILSVAGGFAILATLDYHYHLSVFDWGVLALLSAALMAMTFFKPGIYSNAMWMKLGATLFLALLWTQDAALNDTLAVIGMLAAVYVLIPQGLMRMVPDPRRWAGMQIIAALTLFLTAYSAVPLSESFEAMFSGRFWGIASLILFALSLSQAAYIKSVYAADAKVRDHLIGMYALGGTAFFSLGLVFEVPFEYLPLAFAAQIAATAWIMRYVEIDFSNLLTGILLAVFIVLNFEQFGLFIEIIMKSIHGDWPHSSFVRNMSLSNPLVKLAGSLALLSLALWGGASSSQWTEKTKNAMAATVGALTLMLAYYLLKDALTDVAYPLSIETGFIGRGVITMAILALSVGGLAFAKVMNCAVSRRLAIFFFHFAALRLIWFDLLTQNPFYDNSQFVGDQVILNGVTLTYGLGTLATSWFLMRVPEVMRREWLGKVYKAMSLLLAFCFFTFTIRQYFHGGFMEYGTASDIEIYSYSVAWLLLGIGLLAAGIVKQSLMIRMASLLVLVLTVGKVFLYDARELEGLFRVFSFLGLGFCLIGLSFVYTRYVFGKGAEGKAA